MKTFIGIPEGIDGVTMFVITERPSDYPDSYVLRRWLVSGGDIYSDPCPLRVAPTAAGARVALPSDKVLIQGPGVDPDPVVFEVWA